MTIRISTGMRNALSANLGYAGALNQGAIDIYSGSQPISADAAPTGTLLGTITVGSSPRTVEVQASATLTLSGATGAVNSVLVGGVSISGGVIFRGDLATTAQDVALSINAGGMFVATASGAVLTVKPRPGMGALLNGVALSATTTTLVATSSGNFTGGVNPLNGLLFSESVAGVVSKPLITPWGFIGIANGTAGWFRMVGSVADAGSAIVSAPYLVRVDGSVATSGADMNLSNIVIAVGAPNTIDSFTWTTPSA